jgi:hydroxymethylpyrimidine/phosphomethylpyrimidine kinase
MSSRTVPVILTIAGFDPSSGAGITADLKTIAAHGAYGFAAITALTVQNTQGVVKVDAIEPDLLKQTLSTLAADTEFSAIKIGMLGSGVLASVVAEFLKSHSGPPVVLDPILRSSSGTQLLDEDGFKILRDQLLRLAVVITPNLAEAEALTGRRVGNMVEIKAAAKELQRLGARNVVITGGHSEENVDLVRLESGEKIELVGPKIESTSTHGTGCAFSTAIACRLAAGDSLRDAARGAKEYVKNAIESAYRVGKGAGPLNHLFRLK